MKVIKVGESYICLVKLAELNRSQLVLGRETLMNAFNYFVKCEIQVVRVHGIQLLTLTQMICEIQRILFVIYVVQNFFIIGVLLNEKLLILVHMWTHASRIILNGPKNSFDLYICDEFEDDKVTYNELYHTIRILKNFEGVKSNGANKNRKF